MTFSLNKNIDKTNLILDLIGVKQKAISTNIANVNTPGYVRQEVDFGEYMDSLSRPLETKLSKKLGPSPLLMENGDKVDMSQELVSMQKNSLLYSIAARRVSLIIQQMKTASQVGR